MLLLTIGCVPDSDDAGPRTTSVVPAPAEGLAPPAPPPCQPGLDAGRDPVAALSGAVAELALVVESSAGNNSCAVASEPLCAALYLLAATDPVAGLASGIVPVDRMIVLHLDVLEHTATLADRRGEADLASAIRAMAELDVAAAFAGGDGAVAALAVDRTAAHIIGPIAAAEAAC